MERRTFVQSALAGVLAASQSRAGTAIPQRVYRKDVKVSIIAFGGVVVMGHEQDEVNRLVAAAFERGVNYFDVAPSYGDGEAETKLGPALVPYRNRSFLACKTGKRDAKGASAELAQSLQRLRTDHLDLYQFHAITTQQDVDQILGKGGAAETFLQAKKEGKVRFLGASAHSPQAAIAMMDRFELDSILFPVNIVCWENGGFGPQILDHAQQKGVTRLALKSMAWTRWPKGAAHTKYPNCWYQPIDDPELAKRAVHFTLSQDVTAAVPPGNDHLFSLARDATAQFQPLSDADRRVLLSAAAGVEPIFRA